MPQEGPGYAQAGKRYPGVNIRTERAMGLPVGAAWKRGNPTWFIVELLNPFYPFHLNDILKSKGLIQLPDEIKRKSVFTGIFYSYWRVGEAPILHD